MPDPHNVPVQTRPTPVKSDTLFYEIIDGPVADASRIEYGADHPDTAQFPNFKLCKEERLNHAAARRWWACEFTLQDTYNDGVAYSAENKDYPIFTRRYVVLRDRYLPRTALTALAGVVTVKVTNGGSGYSEAPTVTPNSGTGTFLAVINPSGQVCWVIITNGGTYTSAPTLSFSGGDGTGAAATAFIQNQTALLIAQRKVEFPDDSPLRSIFLIHECVYETLPGPVILLDSDYEEETGAEQRIYDQRVAAGTSKPARGTEYPASSGFFVMSAGLKLSVDNANVGVLHVEVMEQPESREAYRGGNYPTPDVFALTAFPLWPIPPFLPGVPGGPYQNRVDGLDYQGNPLAADENHQSTYELQVNTPASPIKETYSYFITPPGALPATFSVTSQPGHLLPISRNTIHIPLTLVFVNGLDSMVAENLRASTPDTYVDGETVIDAMEDQWKGCWMRRRVDSVEFPPMPNA